MVNRKDNSRCPPGTADARRGGAQLYGAGIGAGRALGRLCGSSIRYGSVRYGTHTAHGQPIVVSGYTVQMLRDTLENWHSEFEVGGLVVFLSLGSPQSREGDERKAAKLDAILRQLGPDGERVIAELHQKFPRR